MEIEFCLQLDISNIEFHVCFAMIVGANMAILNKKMSHRT